MAPPDVIRRYRERACNTVTRGGLRAELQVTHEKNKWL
ncbi:hypothetical protein Ttaiw_00270 [Tepidimonas taiwanensis]|uniref:Uncharacterized protein n=1 Tax=Tepidimonas taiwanensis TaxID=307486 RepID=A0A554XD03_9BURK|nr:hypothetical protein Ttaiw_00270 [Tepidimonas taiwanensis]